MPRPPAAIALLAALLAPGGAAAEPTLRWGVTGAAGVALQSDEYVAGARVEVGPRALPFLELDAGVLAGVGADFLSVRPAVHARLVVRARGLRVYPLIGPSVELYRARGPYADFCGKTGIDCSGEAWGLDLGLGVGWRGLAAEVAIGTGDLPLYTLVVTGTWRQGP